MLRHLRDIFCFGNNKIINKLKKTVQQINYLQEGISKISAADLAGKTKEFRNQIASGKTIDQILPEAFACVKEAIFRSLKIKLFDVQLLGAIVLHKGMIAEMKTGEGKTIVATLAAYLNALQGGGVHVVTVNDYLAKRDSGWMGQIYKLLGMEVGCVLSDMPDHQRKQAYSADIVYATNNELGFDYLRDNMRFSKEEMVQGHLSFAILDEVDSILIDEARTPLIISGPVNDNPHIYNRINRLVKKIDAKDCIIDEKSRNVSFTERGQENVELLLIEAGLLKKEDSLYSAENIQIVHNLNQSLKAHKLFCKDKDYMVKDGKVIIIDEFTGRMMEGRRYSEGLHQALEAKENLRIQSENQTLASVTFQNYFRMYKKLAGMTGTAKTEEEEFLNIYGLKVVQIPTHLKVKRIDKDDEIYASEDEKYSAVLELIKKCNQKGQPVLVGTVSIQKSEKLSAILKSHNLRHCVLNAKYHEQEAQIISQAGRLGAITIATNMAGRGTDIQLGGNKDLMTASNDQQAKEYEDEKNAVCKAGGLYVIGTERHDSRRIDNQLRGRSGRQGDEGCSKFFLSLEDDLLRIFGSSKIRVVLKKLGMKENEAIHHPWITRALEKAQKRVERKNYEMRKSLIKFDDVVNEQRKIVFNQRNRIISDDDLKILDVVRQVNLKILSDAKSKNFYDTNHIKERVKNVYGINLEGIDVVENTEQYIEDQTFTVVLQKDDAYKDKLLLQDIKKRIMIVTLDQLWKEHLYFLDNLKTSVNLRAVAQKNPLNEFKHDAFCAFESLLLEWAETVISSFLRMRIINTN